MENGENKEYIINPPDFKKSIKDGSDFYIQFHSFSPEIESLIIKIIHRYLEKYDIQYMKDTLISVTKELSNNAIKANLKRLYFKLNNMDINNIQDYRKGMETFKTDIFESPDLDIYDKLEKSNLVVRISFKTTNEYIHLNIINNIPILDSELSKINSRIKKAYKYNDIAEAFDDVLDDSEGAGLGLIMAMMLFKNSGLPHETFKIYKKDELTIASISLPQLITKKESTIKITKHILKEIEEIPAFPKNIIEIQKLCNNPETPMKKIADSISLDPGLTTSILKLANSAGYITGKKIESIEEAAKIIGIKGINILLLATGVHKVIDSRYKRFEKIWKDSYKRAYYAQKIAIQLRRTKISEFAYLAALLADIGYIVMYSISSELLTRLTKIAGHKIIENSTTLLEEISLGLSHSKLGALICEKWKFNDALIKAIEYNDKPHLAPENLKQLIYIVHLADCFVEIENNKTRYDIIDEDVLEFFDLLKKESFTLLHNVLKESYSNQLTSQIVL